MLSNICPKCGKDRGNADGSCPHCELKSAEHRRSLRRFVLAYFFVIGLAIFLNFLASIFTGWIGAREAGQWTECMTDLKDVGTALNMYAKDHNGKVPSLLSNLVPKYLKSIPTCLSANKDTYSPSYVCSRSMKDYTVYCKGKNHSRYNGMNYPQYNSREGLITGR